MATKCLGKLKSIKDIPSKTSFPVPWDLILQGGPQYLHSHFDKRHAELGPILRERMGPYELISVAEPSMIRATILNEGRYPQTKLPPAWKLYNDTYGLERGLFFQNGQSWLRMRRALDKILLNTDKIYQFAPDISKLTISLMESWLKQRNCDQSDEFVMDNFSRDLNKWSVEAIGLILFGQKLRNTPHIDGDDKLDGLVDNAIEMFTLSSKLQMVPPNMAKLLNLKVWRDFCSTTDSLMTQTKEYVDHFIKTFRPDQPYPSLLSDMLLSSGLNEDEVSRITVDFMIAAADTTAASIQWALYLLAKNPPTQEAILQEVAPLLSQPNKLVNIDEKTPYLKAFIRESLRLYPPAPFISRSLEKDVVLGDYLVPAGNHIIFPLYTTGRNENYFEDSLHVKPDRWIRDKENSTTNRHQAIASLPFGLGARMCIGRKMAMLEMQIFIAVFLKKFDCTLVNDENVGIKLNMTTWPDRPIAFKLKLR